ncbi:component of the polarisome [Rhizina undulata]
MSTNGDANPPGSRRGLSPVSMAGSDWSEISKYQSGTSDMFGPRDGGGERPPPRVGSLPPGGGGSVPENGNGSHLVIKSGRSSGPPGGLEQPSSSPTTSMARSSDGAGSYTREVVASLKDIIMEEQQVTNHHETLKVFLDPWLSQRGAMRPNKARDKLLRLSKIQFQELSTDVYDELERRRSVSENPSVDNSTYLLPQKIFHPKRNQARQKLSTLPEPRFKDLATDVFFEIERRFPNLAGEYPALMSPTTSVAGSIDGGMRGMPTPGRNGSPGPGMAPPGRIGSPGAGRMGSPGPGMRNGGPGGYGTPGPNGGPRMGIPGPNGQRGMGPGRPGMGVPGVGDSPPGGPQGPNGFGRPLSNNQMGTNNLNDDGARGGEGEEASTSNGRRGTEASIPGSVAGSHARKDSQRSIASMRSAMSGMGGNNVADKKLIADYRSQIENLEEKFAGLEVSLAEKDEIIRQLRLQKQESGTVEDREFQEFRQDMEDKLTHAENLNKSLKSEIVRLKADNADREELREKIRVLEERNLNGGSGGDEEYQQLLKSHEELRMELKEQAEVTEEVRREAMEFLTQMKAISERADDSFAKEEKMHAQITELENEVKEWKTRYARTKATLRSLRASSVGLSLQAPTIAKDNQFSDPNGLIKDIHVTKFQIAIDEFLRVARSPNYAQTLVYVKSVIAVARAVTMDINENAYYEDDRVKLKSTVSATANNLITAAKNHAVGGGLSPVSLVDAAASHLTASIIELIKIVKIRPTSSGELGEDDGEDLIASPDSPSLNFPIFKPAIAGGDSPKFKTSFGEPPKINGARMSGESNYSPLSSPRNSRNKSRNGSIIPGKETWANAVPDLGTGRSRLGSRSEHGNVEDLRIFLEDHTAGIVESIQSLLQAIRADGYMQELRKHVGEIETVVGKVIAWTESSMGQPGNGKLRERGEWIVNNLATIRDKMVVMGEEEGRDLEGPAEKDFKSRLAGLAFDMARETKELVRTVEEIYNEGMVMDVEDSLR